MSKHPVMDTKLSTLRSAIQDIREELDRESYTKLSNEERDDFLNHVNAANDYFLALAYHLKFNRSQ